MEVNRKEIIPPAFLNGLVGVTRGEVSDAFDRVADKAHWKNPIDAEIVLDDCGAFALGRLIEQAVIFYQGVKPTITKLADRGNGQGLYRFQSTGYIG